jgi:predicted transposase YbfD/YdcC
MPEPFVTTLYEQLRQVPDPRSARGKQYSWDFLLMVVSAALAAGKRKLSEISDWVKGHHAEIQQAWERSIERMPSYATVRRVVLCVDILKLEAAIAAYSPSLSDSTGTAQPPAEESPLVGQAIDGKTLRGTVQYKAESRTHLVSLVRHEDAVVLAQQRVENKTNEIRAVPELLRGRDLQNTVTTMDALLTQRTIAQHILDQKGDYLMVVKDNQHELWTAIDVLFHASPLPRGEDDRQTVVTRDKAHGRIERRTLESSVALKDYLDWPGVDQVLRRTCHRVEIRTGRASEEVTYGITSLGRQRASLEQVVQFWRGHWTIENRVHYVRDESMGEDRCQVHTGQAPQALAALRNGVLNAIRHSGWKNVAAALRHFEASAVEALALLGVGVS